MAHIQLANGQAVKELRVWNGLQWEAKTGRVWDGAKWTDFIRPGLTFKDDMATQMGMSRYNATTGITAPTAAKATSLPVLSTTGFYVGQQVTIEDGTNNESVRITAVGTGVLTITPTVRAYKNNAIVARTTSVLTAGKLGFSDLPRLTVYEGRNLISNDGVIFINHLVVERANAGEVVDNKTIKLYQQNAPNGLCVLFKPVDVTTGDTYTLNADMSDTITSVVGVVVYDSNGVILEEEGLLSGSFNWVYTYKSYQLHSDRVLLPPYSFKVLSDKVKYVRVRLGIYRSNLLTRDVLIKEPKLELGTVATPWTPAPEDLL